MQRAPLSNEPSKQYLPTCENDANNSRKTELVASRGAGRVSRLDIGRLRFFRSGVFVRHAGTSVWRNKKRNCLDYDSDAGHETGWRAVVRLALGPLWATNSADGERDLLFDY